MLNDSLTLRIEKPLMEKIKSFSKSKEMPLSESARYLIDLGLKLTALQHDPSLDLEEEFRMMTIDLWIVLAQLYKLNEKDSAPELKKLSAIVRGAMPKKYPKIFERYQGFVKK